MIDLMGNRVWSEREIFDRTEGQVRSQFALAEEVVLLRKGLGALMGAYVLSAQDIEDQQRYAAVAFAAQQAGLQARADNALLAATLDYERALRDVQSDDPAAAGAAQAVIDAASQAVRDLAAMRAPGA